MITTTWQGSTGDYLALGNWSSGVPGMGSFGDTAFFGASAANNISIVTSDTSILLVTPGTWSFSPDASRYNFEIGFGVTLTFAGGGIVINGGTAHLFNFGELGFNASSAGEASITNFNFLTFFASSTADSSIIDTVDGARTVFASFATGSSAQFITEAGGVMDFSQTSGPAKDHRITAGSIAGAGTYRLGEDQLTIGANDLSTTVSGAIDDGGLKPGTGGASLVKLGHGTLTLSGAGNTYSGGTTLEAGALDLAAIGAAGTGAMAFAGRATLKIENSALSAHHFTNPIDMFAEHDVLDLTGLHFHAGATAIYHKASHHLTVHSGHVTDTLTLLAPQSTHFAAASDHHGGTDVFLIFA